VVQTVSFRTLYVFFCINHERRDLIHLNVTTSPTAAWIWHQLLEATPWAVATDHIAASGYGAPFRPASYRVAEWYRGPS
jgi:hypothetical protein